MYFFQRLFSVKYIKRPCSRNWNTSPHFQMNILTTKPGTCAQLFSKALAQCIFNYAKQSGTGSKKEEFGIPSAQRALKK